MADFDNWLWGLGQTESSNNYKALGPVTKRGDRAYGRYQVMGSNVGPWTKQALGQSMTPQEFLASPEAQDAVAKTVAGDYFNKYGPAGAANMWFTGRPNPSSSTSDGYLTAPAYVGRVLANMGKAPGSDAGDPIGFSGDMPAAPQGTNAFANIGGQTQQAQPQPQGNNPGASDWGSALTGAGAALAGISNPAQGASLASMANSAQNRQLQAAALNKPQIMNIGGNIYSVNPLNGQFKQIGNGPQELTTLTSASGAQYQAPKYLQPGQSPQAAPEDVDQSLVDAIGNYKMAPLGRGSRYTNAVMNAVAQKYGDYNAGYWKDIQDVNSEYGPKGKIGQKFTAVNNTMAHAGQLSDLAVDMEKSGQSDVVPWNAIRNIFGTSVGNQTGATNFKTLAGIVGTETAKSLRGAGALSEKEISDWQSRVSSSSTPAQLQQSLGELTQAIAVQERQAYSDYGRGTHGLRKYEDAYPTPLITDVSRKEMEKVQGRADATRQPQASPSSPSGSGAIKFGRDKSGKIVPITEQQANPNGA